MNPILFLANIAEVVLRAGVSSALSTLSHVSYDPAFTLPGSDSDPGSGEFYSQFEDIKLSDADNFCLILQNTHLSHISPRLRGDINFLALGIFAGHLPRQRASEEARIPSRGVTFRFCLQEGRNKFSDDEICICTLSRSGSDII